jgi:hypothetical protein
MLDVTNSTLMNGAGQPATVSGQTISKTRTWTARDRARYAALWKLGALTVRPSTKMAATTFGVSTPLVADAIKEIETDTKRKAAAAATDGSRISDATLRWVVETAGTERTWAAIERQLDLPL